jgi:exodeoxyribonuclease VII large subunit
VIIGTETQVPTVTQLATAIGRKLREIEPGWVEGEVHEVIAARSGHVYLTLIDEHSTIRCCIWKEWAARLDELPAEGELVQARFFRVDFYGQKGTTSLHVDRLRPTGIGQLLRRKAEVRKRLEADGLTEPMRKRALPRFPRRVGLIAGQGAKAKADVITALHDRFPAVEIVFCPALVEGVRAVDAVLGALVTLSRQPQVDVIVLARGGGSVTDLAPFDDERLCRAISACGVPVVTSIGHTPHRPNCDLVASGSAHVPGRTAELVIPSAMDLRANISRLDEALDALPAATRELRRDVAALIERTSPHHKLQSAREQIEGLDRMIGVRAQALYQAQRGGVANLLERLGGIRDHVPEPTELEELDRRLDAAASRLRAGVEDFRQAVLRREREAGRHLERSSVWQRGRAAALVDHLGAPSRELAQNRRHIGELGERLGLAARRRLAAARTEVEHLVATVSAHDFRERGWVLAADLDREAIRTAQQLEAGMTVDLHLHDGRARTVIEEVTVQAKGREE